MMAGAGVLAVTLVRGGVMGPPLKNFTVSMFLCTSIPTRKNFHQRRRDFGKIAPRQKRRNRPSAPARLDRDHRSQVDGMNNSAMTRISGLRRGCQMGKRCLAKMKQPSSRDTSDQTRHCVLDFPILQL